MHFAFERIAAAACHGVDARSLCISGKALPFCARCTGLYIGVAAAVLALAAAGRLSCRRLPRPAAIAALSMPWILSGIARLVEVGGLDAVGNGGRAILGFACGVGGTVLMAPLWARVLWPQGTPRRRSYPAAAALAALIGMVGLASHPAVRPAVRYDCASGAAAIGFVFAAVALNALVIAACRPVIRREGWRQALPAGAAAVEIIGLSVLRGR
jgi:uncharacterized membrane protein